MKQDPFWQVVRILPTDYSDYGGQTQRWQDPNLDYPDCSSGCCHWESMDADWGICLKPGSPRAGLLTWEHQAGLHCFEPDRSAPSESVGSDTGSVPLK